MPSTESARNVIGSANGGLCSVMGPISGDLLRRLGEAEKGYEDGKLHWFVCRLKSIDGAFDVHTCFSPEEAIHVFAKLSDPNAYGVFGPFISPSATASRIEPPRPEAKSEAPPAAETVAALAVEDTVTAPLSLAELVGKVTKVVSVVVKWKNDAATGELEIDAKKYDAIFWGTSSVKKFAIPYYAGANSLEYAVKVHNDFFVAGAYILAHAPDTEYKVYQAGAGEDPTGGKLQPIG